MEQRIVLITGATGFLGRAVADVFASSGARLALTSRSEEALEALADDLALPSERVTTYAADLVDALAIKALVDHVLSLWGRIDCLLNLAGGWRGGIPLVELTDAQWNAMLALNLQTALNISRAVLPVMLEQQDGRIVHIGSQAVEEPSAGQAHYNVAKSGLTALTRSIAAEYGDRGIRANILLSGTINTSRNRNRMPDVDPETFVQPKSLAQIMLLLCGPAGKAINGAAIPVYGGR